MLGPRIHHRRAGAAPPRARRALAIGVLLTATVAAPAVAGASAAPPVPAESVIPAGVSAGGVDLSNLTISAAARRLDSTLGRPLRAILVVGAAGRVFRLRPDHAGLRVDWTAIAQRAYRAGAGRLAPMAGSTAPAITVPVSVTHSQPAVDRFVAGIARTVRRDPRDAYVHMTLAHLYVRHALDGRHVDQRPLDRAIGTALDAPAASHVFHVRLASDRPRVDDRSLRRHFGTVLTVDRSHFRLRLFEHLRYVKSYPIAVGRAGLSTPAGTYHVQEREVNPAWHVPNSSWAGSLAGHTIPGGAPDNPLKARWLGLANGVGIHGTAESWSIGSRASHGCIRMRIGDVIDLYRRAPLGTTVLIG